MAKSSKILFLINLAILILIHLNEIKSQQLYTINLQNLTWASVVRSGQYFKLDSYINTCLNKLETCDNGIFLALDIKITYQSTDKNEYYWNYGRTVIVSSGGESPYSTSGFYLHQLNARGENYLEFGLTVNNEMARTKIYIADLCRVRLWFFYDVSPSQKSVRVYVDGLKFQTIQMIKRSSYINLNFNPFKVVKSLLPQSNSSVINSILFNDTSSDTLQNFIKGTNDDYKIGCYRPTDLLSSDLDSTALKSPFDQCKELCVGLENQVFLIKGLKCICVSDKSELGRHSNNIACNEADAWIAYIGSNIRFDQCHSELKLNVEKIYYKESLVLGDPIAFKITNINNNNYRLVIDFGENIMKNFIGNSFVVHEYSEIGVHSVNITAISLSNTSQIFSKILKINVSKSSDNQPMFSVKLNSLVIDEKKIDLTVNATGGHPYLCIVNYGDSNTKNFESITITSIFKTFYTYNFTGVYNITVICKSLHDSSEVKDSVVVYLPNKSSSRYKNQEYNLNNFKQIVIARSSLLEKEIELELPFVAASSDIKFKTVDFLNPNVSIFDFTIPKTSISNNFVVKLKQKHLKNLNENYILIKANEINLISFLIIVEDPIEMTPEIKIISDPVRKNEPVKFEIKIKKTSNSMLRIDFGDGKSNFFRLYSQDNVDSFNQFLIIKTNNTYDGSFPSYVIKAMLLNHISKQEASVTIEFQSSLPKFILTATNVGDVSQYVTFKLQPSNMSLGPVEVGNVNFMFDSNSNLSSNQRLFSNYIFDKSNNNSLTVSFKYNNYGYFQVTANCSNMISSIVAKTSVKVGTNLGTANGYILNSYANVHEYVYLNLKINGGNGYHFEINYGDSNIMYLPWSFLSTNGNQVNYSDVPSNFTLPKAKFTTYGVQPMYKYSSPGEYNINVEIINPFSSLVLGFCSKVFIQSERSEDKYSNTNFTCEISESTIGLFIDSVYLAPESIFNFPRGIRNTLMIELLNCENQELKEITESTIKSIWVISRVLSNKNLDHEEPIEKYCFLPSENNQYIIEPNEFEFGDFMLKVYAFKNSTPNNYIKFTNILRVSASPLMIKLNNNQKKVEINTDEILNLDFYSSTYDPDLKDKNDKKNMNFYIFCIGSREMKFQNELLGKIKNKFINNEYDFNNTDLGFSMAFEESRFKMLVYDLDCFFDFQGIGFNNESNSIEFEGQYMNLNNSNMKPLIVEVVVSKGQRFTISKPLKVVLNLSSIINLVPSTDLSKMSEQLDRLDDFAKTNPVKALDILGSFVDAINIVADEEKLNETTTTTTTQASITDRNNEFSSLRGKMINTVGTIVERIDDPTQLIKAANTTASVSGNSNQMPSKNQDTGGSVMLIMGEKAKNISGDQDPELILGLASAMLDVGSNLFSAGEGSAPVAVEDKTSLTLLEPEPENVTEPVPLAAKIVAPLEFYTCNDPSCEEDFPEDRFEAFLTEQEEKDTSEREQRIKTAEIAKKTFNGMSKAGDALVSGPPKLGSENSSNTTSINKKNMAMSVSKKNLSETADEPTTIGSDSGLTINMPKFGSVLGDQAPQAISTQFLMSNSNPFQGSSKTKQTSGTIVSLSLKDESGNPLKINNTSEPFVIRIPAQEPAESFNSSVDLTGITYFKTLLASSSSSLHVVLIPLILGDIYHVYIKYSPTKIISVYPDAQNYDYYYTIPNNKTIIDSQFDDLKYTAFIRSNETKGNGTYYIGVKLAILSNETKSAIQKNENQSSNITISIKSYYTVKIFSSACKYFEEETQEWKTDGCIVGEYSTFNSTECLCYHLTTFGTDFYTPPNTIDFSSVWGKFKNLGDNAAVFSVVVSIIGIYVLLCIYVRYLDKKDLIKWGATPLSDNLPTDNYYYLISVQTGVGKDCGTTSKIGFVLSGENSDSGVRNLTDSKRRAFKSGTVCNFIMSVEEALGSLTYLRIWHDNSGRGNSKSWYLNVVNIVDLQTNDKSSFVCNDWLAVEKSDGQIDRVLPVACKNDLTTFKHLFTQSVKKKFTDNHLWFSVISRPTKSSFTRTQRLSCCMSLLFCTMIANAMFYRSEENASAKAGRVELGPIKFSMSQLFTSIISTLIVVPVNVIIVTLFRKAKLKTHGIAPSRSKHVAKQQYWRRVKVIENIDLPENENNETMFDEKKAESEIEASIKHNRIKRLFSKPPNEYKRESREDARNKKQGRNLPHWTIYISWFLVIVSILVPAFFVILYSMQWGKDRSNAWLMSISLSFFQSLLVVDPLKVFLITAAITFILRKPDDDDDSLIDSGDPFYNAIVNRDEEYLHKTTASLSQIDIREILESRKTKLTQLTPIDPEELEIQRQERLKIIKMKEILREGASYLCFVIVVLFLAHQSRSQNARKIHSDLTNTFLINNLMAFEDIQTRPDFWSYLETVFLPGIYAPKWYNNKSLTWREKLTIENRYAIRVGAPRIRQLRVKENTCKVFPRFSNIITHCRDNYNWVDDDTKDYEPGWAKRSEDNIKDLTTSTTSTTLHPTPKKDDSPYSDLPKFIKSKYKCRNPWCYQNTLQTKSAPILGHYNTYKGGGYALSLGRTLEKTLKMINVLKDQNWIDQLTRAVFLEFSFYNPNVNLFSTGTLIVEYLSTGAAVHYQSINVCQLYNYLGSFGIIVLVFEIIFVIFWIYFLVTEILKLKTEKIGYFKKFWNLNEFVIVTFSLVSMVMFGMRTVFTKLAIDEVHKSEMGDFVNFNTIGMWDEMYTNISAVIVFCATLKFLKLLRFNKRIGMLAATLRYAIKDLAAFSVTFCIIFFAFTQYGFLIFGAMANSYKSFLSALASVFRFSLGQFDLKELQDADYLFGSIYFVLFVLIVIMGLMSMFVTILNEAFEKVKGDLENQANEHEIIDFIFESVKSIKNRKSNKKKASKAKLKQINECEHTLKVTLKNQDSELKNRKFTQFDESYDINNF